MKFNNSMASAKHKRTARLIIYLSVALTAIGASYELRSSIGQVDVNAPSSGGDYALSSGF